MPARLLKFWFDLRASYWFVPAVMTTLAAAASFVTTHLDATGGSAWMDEVSWLRANRPEGARALLSTIAGSMITVAGVTFSITIAAVAYASAQYGPRILTNFMGDRGNQLTLGTFIGTFIYCLLVLRTIRSAEEVPPGGTVDASTLAEAFVPHLSVLCALVLTVASVGVLIFFIHHIPQSIHVSNVAAGIGRDLLHKLHHLFPEEVGHPGAPPRVGRPEQNPEDNLPLGFYGTSVGVPAGGTGYVQAIDTDVLLHVAREYDLVLRLLIRPGDFVTAAKPLVYAWPAAHLDEHACSRLRDAFAWGSHRTREQDVMFLVNELVEIAARALSPGVNDPFTAMSCLDWLGSTLSELARRRIPDAFRYDDDGRLRVIARTITFHTFAAAIFGRLRPYVSRDRNAALHTVKVLGEVADDIRTLQQRDALIHHAGRLLRACEAAPLLEDDLKEVRRRLRVVVRILHDPGARKQLESTRRWIGGSA